MLKENRKMWIGLMWFMLIPFAHQIIQTRLVTSLPSTDSISIIGQMEWFDLINEILQAFLIVPLYRMGFSLSFRQFRFLTILHL